jgi:hypothetical protein
MRKHFVPWFNNKGNRPESIVRLNDRCLGLRVRLANGERVTMPLGQTTFKMGEPR